MRSAFSLTLALALGALAASAAERWELQYFYDENKSSLTINDLAFPTAQRGVAVGYVEEGGNLRGRAVVTSDGGSRWTMVPLPQPGLSVFFLNDTLGWVVTPRGIYRTDEGGRSWRKLPKSPRYAMRVWFLDPQHGFAVGARKSAYETLDGGKSWKPLAAAGSVKTREEHTAFTFISFQGPVGYIGGTHRAPRHDESDLPDWLEPEKAVRRKEWPGTAILLATNDGGKTWRPSVSSIFGQISRLRLSADGRALSLVEYRRDFQHPSEVYAIDKTGRSHPVYARKDRAVTDLAVVRSGPVFLAATEVAGRLQRTPVPGRLHMVRSDDLKSWRDMEVDYRANARRAVLAAADARNVWVATDTGMILKLTE